MTVVINFIFIWDTTKKYSRDRNGPNANTADERLSQLERNEKTGMAFKTNFILTDSIIYWKTIHLRLQWCTNSKIMEKLYEPHF